MIKNKISLWLLTLAPFAGIAQRILPADKHATIQTVSLYNNLKQLSAKGFLFGHQDDLAYGMNWKYVAGKSDVKDVTGEYPALYGWDLSHLELGETLNIDTVPFDHIKHYIRQAYQQGSVVTISWHGTNPLTGKSAWDNTPGTVAAILPGGAKHDLFKSQLDKVAAFLSDLKGKNGEPIPVLFRPFHELTGNWFWWGSSACSPNEFKSIYRFTVTYLRDVKKVHNLLYIFNTGADFKSADEYLLRYPGDDLVDMLTFDDYQSGGPQNGPAFIKEVANGLGIVEQLAAKKHKLSALAEAGYNQVPDPQWWTNTLMKALEGHHPAYVLIWRNAGIKGDKSIEYYAPYPGQASAADFVKFYQLPQTLFQKDAARAKLYRQL